MKLLRAEKLASEEAADQAQGKAESNDAACTAAQDAARVADSRIDVTRAQLDRTQLRAPFAGVIAEINGEVGEFVTPSPVGIPTPPTVDLIDATCLYISAPIDEVDAPRVQEGLPARISLDAFPNADVPGPRAPRRAVRARPREAGAHRRDRGRVRRTREARACCRATAPTSRWCSPQRADVLRVPSSVILPTKRSTCSIRHAASSPSRPVETGIANWEFTEILSGLARRRAVVSSVDRDGRARRRAAPPK